MKVAVMQPYFFPYLGYFQLIHSVDHFVILDDVNYIKRGYVNRNSILSNGAPLRLTLSVEKASQNRLINQHNHLRQTDGLIKTIQASYKKAPFFETVFELLREGLLNPEIRLDKYLSYQLELLSDYMKLNTEFSYSSNLPTSKGLRGQQKILEVCLLKKATNYINPIGGLALYDKDEFNKNQIKLNFIQSKPYSYQQFNGDFIGNLSIIDVLMFNSIEEVQILLSDYELI